MCNLIGARRVTLFVCGQMSDVLRVHEYSYIHMLVDACNRALEDNTAVVHLDMDTAVSRYVIHYNLRPSALCPHFTLQSFPKSRCRALRLPDHGSRMVCGGLC